GTDEGTDKCAAADEGGDEELYKIAMVTATGRIDYRSFNQSAWEGMKDWQDENGLDEDSIHYYQSDTENDYIPHMNTATNADYDIVYAVGFLLADPIQTDRKSTRLNSSHVSISYAVFCL